MRVLYVVTAFPRHEGDVITPWLVTLVRALKEEGVDIEILTASHRTGGKEKVFGLRVHRFRYFFRPFEILSYTEAIPEQLKRGWPSLLVPPFIAGGFLKAVRLASSRKYDIVHVHWPFPCALFALPFGRTPTVYTFYTAEVALAEKFGPFKWIFKWLVKKANALVFLTSYARDRFSRSFGIPDGKLVEIIPYMPAGEGELPKLRGELYRVLFVGRLVERKGVIYLIRAVDILRRKFPSVKLVIVGGGPEEGRLKEEVRRLRLERFVEFRGVISDQEKEEEYSKAHVFVLPAIVDSKGDTEGQGVVILEAMRAGVPVVASEVGGIPDLVIDGRTGLLVPQKNPQALAVAIERIFTDEKTARQLVEGAKKHLMQNFSREAVVKKTLKLYERLLQ